MKLKIIIAVLFMFPLIMFSQAVIREAESMTDKRKQEQKIEAEILKLSDENYKTWMQYQQTFNKLNPLDVVLNPTREKLDKKIQNIEQALYEIQRLNLKQKCEQINTLSKSIGKTSNSCVDIDGRIARLNERQKEVVDKIAKLQRENNKEERTLSFGTNESDEFWNGKSDDDAKKTASSTKDDFWNGKTEKVAESDKEDDFWNGKEKLSNKRTYEVKNSLNNSGEIIRDNNANYAVKDNQGRIVIPFGKYLEISYLDLNNKQFFIAKQKKKITKNELWNINNYNSRSLVNINGDVVIDNYNSSYEWQETIDGNGVKRYIFYYVKNIRHLRTYKKPNRYNKNGYLWHVDYELDVTASYYNINMKQYKTEIGVHAKTSLKSHWGK